MFRLIVLFSVFNCFISNPINDSIDWRTKGAVLPVPDQGSCGSAAIEAALDSISAAQKIKHGNLVRLSKQQIFDCSPVICPCQGTQKTTDVYNLIFEQGDLMDSEATYPYTGVCDKVCKFKKSEAVVTFNAFESYYNMNKSLETTLYGALQLGPVAVEIQANTEQFQLYTGGIFDDPECKGETLDHTLLFVGAGSENGVDYWIARNSWGPNWGEKGYIRIVRNKTMCGIGYSWANPYVL